MANPGAATCGWVGPPGIKKALLFSILNTYREEGGSEALRPVKPVKIYLRLIMTVGM
jgi:hypothetical protein